jgi:hypothetical protein
VRFADRRTASAARAVMSAGTSVVVGCDVGGVGATSAISKIVGLIVQRSCERYIVAGGAEKGSMQLSQKLAKVDVTRVKPGKSRTPPSGVLRVARKMHH